MDKQFIEINPEQITDNTFKLISSDWMLITAGNMQSFNTMTASWGGLGVLWNKNVAFCFVRPSRYTYGFMEKAWGFTLSFFDKQYRKALNFCGSHSGRDCDKVAETGLTPVSFDDEMVYFEQARMVLICKKLYFHDIIPAHFLDPALDGINYPLKDYHRMYIAEIMKVFLQQD